jgi:hypothetical protein
MIGSVGLTQTRPVNSNYQALSLFWKMLPRSRVLTGLLLVHIRVHALHLERIMHGKIFLARFGASSLGTKPYISGTHARLRKYVNLLTCRLPCYRQHHTRIYLSNGIWFLHYTITTTAQQPLTWGWALVCGIHPHVRGCYAVVVLVL